MDGEFPAGFSEEDYRELLFTNLSEGLRETQASFKKFVELGLIDEETCRGIIERHSTIIGKFSSAIRFDSELGAVLQSYNIKKSD